MARRFEGEGRGLQLLGERETEKVIINVFAYGAMVIEMLLSKAAEAFGEFLIAKVSAGEKILWSFKDEDFNGFGRLWWCQQLAENFIVLVTRRREIVKVIALKDLPDMHWAEVAGKKRLIGGRNVLEILRAKKMLAKENDFNLVLSEDEKRVEKYLRDKALADVKDRQLAEQAVLAEKARQREEAVKAILARQKVFAWREDNGQEIFGIPVCNEQEWIMLPDGSRVIMVNEESAPTEAFIVSKKIGGRCKKANLLKVSAQRQIPKSEQKTEALFTTNETKLFVVDNMPVEVAVVTLEQKRALRHLNSNTLLAVPEGEGYKLYRMMGENGDETLAGLYQPL